MNAQRWSRYLLLSVSFTLTAPAMPLVAAMSSDEDSRALPADDDYTKGRDAFEREDWQGVIDHMSKTISRRPWHDNAYSLLGFAHRKLGDYEKSLSFYDKALTLNPHNRGALEYLGEAYLDLDTPESTLEILSRLEVECKRIASRFPDNDWRTGCEEWVHLNAAYQAHIDGRPRPEHD